ncbi:hypothetical protein KR018_005223 [Drosophila ironensis]|nr:hypothetical protein KR018_005223 [Drosophila ironensis]
MGSAVVDVDDPSPPKRACTSMNQSQKDDPYSCPVCLEGVRNREPVSTKCGHVFCRACIDTAIRTTRKCPMCQKRLTAKSYFRLFM